MIRRKIPWTSQPQSPVELNSVWASSIAFLSLTGVPFRKDLKTGTLPTTIGTMTSVATQVGMASVPTNTSSGYRWVNTTPISSTDNGYSAIVVAAPVSRAAKGRVFLLGDEAPAAYKQAALIWNSNQATVTAAGKIAFVEYSTGLLSRCETLNTEIDGKWHVYIINRLPGTTAPSIYVDGVDKTSSSTASAGFALPAGVYLHVPPSSSTEGAIDPLAFNAVLNRSLSIAEIATLSRSLSAPYQLLAPQERRAFVSVASSGITGTFSVIESVDIPAISGLVNHFGSLVVTESPDITSISGKIVHLGNLSVTESSDTFAASGTVSGSAIITGSLALTEISDTASLIGKVAHTGALVVTETADTVSFNGLVAHTGTLAATESADVVAITGGSQITITGSIAITEPPDVANFRGPSGNTFSQEVEFRRYYVRKGKKILLFDSVDEAEEYIKAEELAEEAIAKAKVSSRQERRKIKKRIIKYVLPAESIDTDWLAEMMQRFAINFDLPKLLAEQDYNRVMEIHAMAKAMQDDEDDIEMLLMWG